MPDSDVYIQYRDPDARPEQFTASCVIFPKKDSDINMMSFTLRPQSSRYRSHIKYIALDEIRSMDILTKYPN